MPEESHFHQKALLTLSCFLCARCSMERPCCECHVHLAPREDRRAERKDVPIWRPQTWDQISAKRLTGEQQQQVDGGGGGGGWRAERWTLFRGVMWADSVPQGWRAGRRGDVASGIPGAAEPRAQLGVLGAISHSFFPSSSMRDESNGAVSLNGTTLHLGSRCTHSR